jgi:hypothetical protein
MRSCATVATIAGLAVCESFGGTVTDTSAETCTPANQAKWECSLSTYTYLSLHSRDYVNPNFTADHDWLHLETRYNYEAIKTGSVWLGYNFTTGKKLELALTPMFGGVFGDITGIAPGYFLSIRYKSVELSSQGEYFFDSKTYSNDFFYSWSELSYAPAEWFRVGAVVDRTNGLGSNSEIRRGPFIGFKYRNVDLTTYWLSPGSSDAAFVFAVTLNF